MGVGRHGGDVARSPHMRLALDPARIVDGQAEAVWSTFKREAIDDRHFAARAEARRTIFSWNVWYNSTRLRTRIGRGPPIEHEAHLSRPPQWRCVETTTVFIHQAVPGPIGGVRDDRVSPGSS